MSAVVLVLALAAGMVRLLPWVLAPDLPWGIVAPFARALAAVALETALLVGVPVGAALGSAALVERGEARALFALGASPLRLSRDAAIPLIAAAALSLVATLAWQPSADRPGAFAQTLIQQGSNGCDRAGVQSVGVPIVGVTWLCFGGAGAQRLAGPVPKTQGRAWYTAQTLDVSDDLSVFRAREVRLATRPEPDRPHLVLQVRTAAIHGMPAWGRGAPLEVADRALLVALWILLQSSLACWAVLRFGLGRGLGLLIGATPALFVLRALHALPPGSGPLEAAFRVLGVGIAVLAACLVLPRLVGRPRARRILRRSAELWGSSPDTKRER